MVLVYLTCVLPDDLILLAKASREQVRVVKGILDIFWSSSGQQINHKKSSIYFSKKFYASRHKELSDMFDFRLTSNFGRYLGIPLTHEKYKASDFQFILDNMNHR